jgi:ABC-type glycerol-3-phosphate transport system substrate-binding protein
MKASFQIVVLLLFIAAAVFGVFVFSGAIPIGNSGEGGAEGTVVVWGTVKNNDLFKAFEDFHNANPGFRVNYVEKTPASFDHDLLEALASGTGPDMVFLPEELIFHYANKITTIPYYTYSLAQFKNTFAGAGEIFLNSSGILAFPMAIDPLMMYYNRSMLDASAVVYPPEYWDQVLEVIPTLTKKDEANKILKSGIALGQFVNIVHAKDILAALFMQSGNPIVSEKSGALLSALDDPGFQTSLPQTLEFYTDFANPNKQVYSWNRSFPDSRTAFSAEDVALYFGFASEIYSLINQNPNQNFLIAPVPQLKGSPFKLTDAHVTGLAILATTKNLNTAFVAASLMASGPFAEAFRSALRVAPARRDLLAIKQNDAYSPIFYSSALFGRSWVDPSPTDTDNIFRGMIEGVLSGNLSPADAVHDASARLNLLFNK